MHLAGAGGGFMEDSRLIIRVGVRVGVHYTITIETPTYTQLCAVLCLFFLGYLSA